MSDVLEVAPLWNESEAVFDQGNWSETQVTPIAVPELGTQFSMSYWREYGDAVSEPFGSWKRYLSLLNSELQSKPLSIIPIVDIAAASSVNWRFATVGRSLRRWQVEVSLRLQQLGRASLDKEGFDSLSTWILQKAWRTAIAVFPEEVPTPSVIANSDGGVDFRWYRAGWDVQLAIDPDETTVWFRSRENNEIFYGPLAQYREKLRELFEAFASL